VRHNHFKWNKRAFCDLNCRDEFLRSPDGRRQQSSYRKGVELDDLEKQRRRRTAKENIRRGHTEWMSNLQNVDLDRRRKCKWRGCINYVFGEKDYCNKHWLQTEAGKLENQARAFFWYHIGLSLSDVPDEIVELFKEYQKTKKEVER
jgi:hypothetical protein